MKKMFSALKGAAAVLALAATCQAGLAQTKVYRIAVMPFGLPEYMSKWSTQMREHPMVKSGRVKMTVLDGKSDPLVQTNQMETVITEKYDAVIFAPMDFNAATAPIAKATAAKIPVVGSVTRADSDKLFAYVGTNDVEGGKLIAEHLVRQLGGKGNIVILEGPIGNSPQLLRQKGIQEVLAANPGIKVIADKTANWSRAEGLTVMENWLSAYAGKINGVIAHNDEMALGAIEAMRSKKIDPKTIPVVAIDGIPDGQRAVRDGNLFTLYKDASAEGQGALDLAVRAVMGSTYKPTADVWSNGLAWRDGTARQYDVPWIALTPANVGKYLH
jgi:putative xylitol transport system substrate-binding protein